MESATDKLVVPNKPLVLRYIGNIRLETADALVRIVLNMRQRFIRDHVIAEGDHILGEQPLPYAQRHHVECQHLDDPKHFLRDPYSELILFIVEASFSQSSVR